jgi:hypothetical protein
MVRFLVFPPPRPHGVLGSLIAGGGVVPAEHPEAVAPPARRRRRRLGVAQRLGDGHPRVGVPPLPGGVRLITLRGLYRLSSACVFDYTPY